ncbi:hypothetical protein GCM10027040_27720 [Halomonas shantousis]
MDWDSVGNLFSSAAKYATTAFDWIGENPEAANLIGGVAVGVGQAYLQNKEAEDQRAFDMQMYKRKREDAYAKPGEIGNYGSHLNTVTNGLISNGLITEGQ